MATPTQVPRVREARETIASVYDSADVTSSGDHATTVNQLTDQLPALQPETLAAAGTLLAEGGEYDVDTLAVEEDKGPRSASSWRERTTFHSRSHAGTRTRSTAERRSTKRC